jgi:pimeloyl-ACP methyl ester carboxylesterase
MVHYRSAETDGHRVSYREAGEAQSPAVLLLHGFPTSSHMFRDLIPLLADRYRVVAPDLPGFGNTISIRGEPSSSIAAWRQSGSWSARWIRPDLFCTVRFPGWRP